jgi:hypothetical protein
MDRTPFLTKVEQIITSHLIACKFGLLSIEYVIRSCYSIVSDVRVKPRSIRLAFLTGVILWLFHGYP